MWGHDASWWALVLAILALVLMLPVNLLANVMTPPLKNWWAGRSSAALTERIARVKRNLVAAEKNTPLTETESELFKALDSITQLVWAIGYFTLASLLVLGAILIPKTITQRMELIIGIAVFGTIISYRYALVHRDIKGYRISHSRGYANTLRVTITELEGKLRDKLSGRM